jgi:molybdenum cofactor cytidylyltransferase
MIYAVVPAAGHSRRMGRPKLDLLIAGKPVLAHVVDALRQGGVDRILVVLGPHVTHLAATAAPAQTLILDEATPDMRCTVEHGLRCLETRFHPTAADAWLLAPADHPTLAPDVIRTLIATWHANPEHHVFIPTCGGKRGHPTLLAWRIVAALHAHPLGEGLNAFIRSQPCRTDEVAVNDAEILTDLDTPADYQRLCGAAHTDQPLGETRTT